MPPIIIAINAILFGMFVAGGIAVAVTVDKAKKAKINHDQKADLKKIDQLSKGLVKEKDYDKAISYKFAMHIVSVVKNKVFLLNKRHTLDSVTERSGKKIKATKQIDAYEAEIDMLGKKVKYKNLRESTYAVKVESLKTKIEHIKNKELTDDMMAPLSYDRTVILPDGSDFVDHRTGIDCHTESVYKKFKSLVEEKYYEPSKPYPIVAELSFGGKEILSSRVSSPSPIIMEEGKKLLVEDAITKISELSPQQMKDMFPLVIKEVVASKNKQRKIKTTTFNTLDEARDFSKAEINPHLLRLPAGEIVEK